MDVALRALKYFTSIFFNTTFLNIFSDTIVIIFIIKRVFVWLFILLVFLFLSHQIIYIYIVKIVWIFIISALTTLLMERVFLVAACIGIIIGVVKIIRVFFLLLLFGRRLLLVFFISALLSSKRVVTIFIHIEFVSII